MEHLDTDIMNICMLLASHAPSLTTWFYLTSEGVCYGSILCFGGVQSGINGEDKKGDLGWD